LACPAGRPNQPHYYAKEPGRLAVDTTEYDAYAFLRRGKRKFGIKATNGMPPIKVMVLFAVGLTGALSSSAQNASSPAPQPAPSSKHTITVNFDYDFSKTPACSKTVTKASVQKFIVYDISAGLKVRTKLFSIPVPPGETKLVKGIMGKSPLLLIESGRHRIAVTAQMADGKESDIDAGMTWVEVPASENKLVTAPK
jgi:hypothetical protein